MYKSNIFGIHRVYRILLCVWFSWTLLVLNQDLVKTHSEGWKIVATSRSGKGRIFRTSYLYSYSYGQLAPLKYKLKPLFKIFLYTPRFPLIKQCTATRCVEAIKRSLGLGPSRVRSDWERSALRKMCTLSTIALLLHRRFFSVYLITRKSGQALRGARLPPLTPKAHRELTARIIGCWVFVVCWLGWRKINSMAP